MPVKKTLKELSFEEELGRLEALASDMEQGEMQLDALMNAYDEWMKLAASLQARLEKAKAHLTEVKVSSDGQTTLVPTEVVEQGTLLDGLGK